MDNERRIPKLVIIPQDIDKKIYFKEFMQCHECNSNLMYILEEQGIVKEDDYYITGNKSKMYFRLSVVSIHTHCAECGHYVENYFRLYDENKVVYTFEDYLDEDDKAEIEHCISQFNQNHDFKPLYKFPELDKIKEALLKAVKNENKKRIKKDTRRKKKA